MWVQSLGQDDPLGGRQWNLEGRILPLENPMDRGSQASVQEDSQRVR